MVAPRPGVSLTPKRSSNIAGNASVATSCRAACRSEASRCPPALPERFSRPIGRSTQAVLGRPQRSDLQLGSCGPGSSPFDFLRALSCDPRLDFSSRPRKARGLLMQRASQSVELIRGAFVRLAVLRRLVIGEAMPCRRALPGTQRSNASARGNVRGNARGNGRMADSKPKSLHPLLQPGTASIRSPFSS